MARPLRIEYEGAVYHVTLRGNQRREIFRSDQDRERFLSKLAESLQQFDVHLYLYCLMTNHVHMVLRDTTGKSESLGNQWGLFKGIEVSGHPEKTRDGPYFRGNPGRESVDILLVSPFH